MKAGKNCRVRLNYAIRMLDGEVVEENPAGQPLEFVTGREQVIACLEAGVVGMEAGETKSFEVTAEEGFGMRDPEAVRIVPREELEDHGDSLEEGMFFRVKDEQGNNLVITVLSLDDEEVVFDLNHPLAGAPLRFEVEVLEVCEEAPTSH